MVHAAERHMAMQGARQCGAHSCEGQYDVVHAATRGMATSICSNEGACQLCYASLLSSWLVVGAGGPLRERAAMSVSEKGRVW